MNARSGLIAVCLFLAARPSLCAPAQSAAAEPASGDQLFARYFQAQVDALASSCLANISSLADWESRRPELRRQAAEMLGLDPRPEKTPLYPVITGKLEREDFTVEKLYFESQPHLYVTANLYLPRPQSAPAPALLYLCGHKPVISNGISFGNKTAYQHHGIWFARNGYVCLVLDTLQWGEIRGRHQGTYAQAQWWWNARGYTPAGVETWNALRALDYLVSRPEVDGNRLGVTGRSGGGAYSWFVAALDDRVKVIAPVAGLTDLRNYVLDGKVDSHCDCMFPINTYRWDFPLLAALCAPRPLLLANTEADPLFPLDGVLRTRDQVKRIYDLYNATTNFGLTIAPGTHADTQDLQVPVFRWFNIHLKHSDPPIGMAAVSLFSPPQLKVFDAIPPNQINTEIQASFVPSAPPAEVPATAQAWAELRQRWMTGLKEKCFAGWPADSKPATLRQVRVQQSKGVSYEVCEIQSQPEVDLRLYLMCRAGKRKPTNLYVHLADSAFTNSLPERASGPGPAMMEVKNAFGDPEATEELLNEIQRDNTAQALLLTRGIGPAAGSAGAGSDTRLRRRFMLLGQTLDSMRVWDIRRAVQALHSQTEFPNTPLCLEAKGEMAVNALYASLFEPEIGELRLSHVPSSHAQGPDYLNVLRVLDIPQAAAMASERCQVRLEPDHAGGWQFLREMASHSVAKLKLSFEE